MPPHKKHHKKDKKKSSRSSRDNYKDKSYSYNDYEVMYRNLINSTNYKSPISTTSKEVKQPENINTRNPNAPIPPISSTAVRAVNVCIYILSDVNPSITENMIRTQLALASNIWSNYAGDFMFRPRFCDLRSNSCHLDKDIVNLTINKDQIPYSPNDSLPSTVQDTFDSIRNESNCSSQSNNLAVFYINADQLNNGAIGRTYNNNTIMTYGTFTPNNWDILAHEFGHAFGLQHVNDENNIMYPSGTQVNPDTSAQLLRSMATNSQKRTVYSSKYVYLLQTN